MRTVLVDFDGVLHSYVSGWNGKEQIPDPPNDGAIAWLRTLIESPEVEPVIFTTRVHCGENDDPDPSHQAELAIRNWLYLNGLSREEVDGLRITDQKVPAVLTIDDRALKFEGHFPTLAMIKNFQPWKAS